MILELPDTLDLTDVAKQLAGLGLAIDGKVYIDGIRRTVPIRCEVAGCQSRADIHSGGRFVCSTHELARIRAAGL